MRGYLRIAVRADASTVIGVGHIMRCLTLVNRLRNLNPETQVLFICRDYPGHLQDLITKQGYESVLLPGSPVSLDDGADNWLGETEEDDAASTIACLSDRFSTTLDLLIVDHYGIGRIWESRLQKKTRKLMVIDDLANRHHDCDLLLDQTFSTTISDYKNLTLSGCKVLTGSRYTLLREEFKLAKKMIHSKRNENWPPGRLLVSMGGSDPGNTTLTVLQALADMDTSLSVTVIAGPSFLHVESLRDFCNRKGQYRLLCSPENMAELMICHDIAIGAAGGTSWERCAMGLPTVCLVIAENQRKIAAQLASIGATRTLVGPLQRDILARALQPWLSDKAQYMQAVDAALEVCDGMGTDRVIEAILTP